MRTHYLLGGLTIALVMGVLRSASAEPGPMQKWMRGNLASAVGQGDTAKVASGLRYVAGKPVPGMDQWTAIATKGAEAAEKGDIDGTKASCKACHNLYQKTYKETRRQEKW